MKQALLIKENLKKAKELVLKKTKVQKPVVCSRVTSQEKAFVKPTKKTKALKTVTGKVFDPEKRSKAESDEEEQKIEEAEESSKNDHEVSITIKLKNRSGASGNVKDLNKASTEIMEKILKALK